jgi:hypothetical protein
MPQRGGGSGVQDSEAGAGGVHAFEVEDGGSGGVERLGSSKDRYRRHPASTSTVLATGAMAEKNSLPPLAPSAFTPPSTPLLRPY